MAKKEEKAPEDMTPEEKLKQLKAVSRFSLFMGINFANLGFLALFSAILMNTSENPDLQFFSWAVVVVGGFLWHSAYLSISSSREMKRFSSVEEYIEHVKKKREAEERSKR